MMVTMTLMMAVPTLFLCYVFLSECTQIENCIHTTKYHGWQNNIQVENCGYLISMIGEGLLF
jgi:hypothetical protein